MFLTILIIITAWVSYGLFWGLGPISIATASIFSLAWLFREKISGAVDARIATKAAKAPQSVLGKWYFTPEAIKKSASGADQPERKVSDKTRKSVHNITCSIILVLGFLPGIIKGLGLGASALWSSLSGSLIQMVQDLTLANGVGWMIFSIFMWILSLLVVLILGHIVLQAVVSAVMRRHWQGILPKFMPWTIWFFGHGKTQPVAAIAYLLQRVIACFYFERSFGALVIEVVVIFVATRLLWRLTRNLLPWVAEKLMSGVIAPIVRLFQKP